MSTWREDATKLLSKYGKVRDHSTRDFGREPHRDAIAVVIGGGGAMVEEHAVEKLRELRKKLPPGTVAWLGTTRWLGAEKFEGLVELAVGEGATQFDILRHAASDGINHGLETEDLIAKLTKWHGEHGVDVFHAESDTIELELLREPEDRMAFAQELYAFCPDIVDQGIGSVEALAESLERQHIYLWWD
jgi:hypothetical protein